MAAIDIRYTMHPGDAARVLGVTPMRVRQMDDVLKPIRVGAGSSTVRRYDPRHVEKIAKKRAAAVGASR